MLLSTRKEEILLKLNIVIDEKRQEEIIIYAHKKTSLIKEIEKLVEENSIDFLGKKENELIKFDANDVVCFVVEDNKVFAHLEKEKLQIKTRLYKLEEVLPDNFIKINQSAIANIKKIK